MALTCAASIGAASRWWMRHCFLALSQKEGRKSFILADQNSLELGYRLRLRVAHLLGKTVEQRRQLYKHVEHLYAIRSKIVHSRECQVADADLALMRWICKAS